jgi:hypothetical protein
MEPKIRNSNFIGKLMTTKDVQKAFTFDGGVQDYIYDVLIEEGYVRRMSDRHFKPTDKLLQMITPKMVVLTGDFRRFLVANSSFYKQEAVGIFGELVINAMINKGYLVLGVDKRFRKSDEFEDMIAEGESEIHF